jgi:hypothetical protein
MTNWVEKLGLDRELIERDREMAAGMGRAHLRIARNPEYAATAFSHAMAGATEYRRAGAHSLLAGDPGAAQKHFIEAGTLYLRGGNPYGLLMFACGGIAARRLDVPAHEYGLLEGADRLHRPYLILAGTAGGWYRGGEADETELGGSRATSIGMFGLPLGAYLDLAHAVNEERIGNREAVTRACMPFLSAYSNTFARARENSYHWRKMAMPFHPAEPDVLSLLLLVDSATRERGQPWLGGMLRRLPLPAEPMELLAELLQWPSESDYEAESQR